MLVSITQQRTTPAGLFAPSHLWDDETEARSPHALECDRCDAESCEFDSSSFLEHWCADAVYHLFVRASFVAGQPNRSLCENQTAESFETKTPGARHCVECLRAAGVPETDWRWRRIVL